jgi:hypothetical protein
MQIFTVLGFDVIIPPQYIPDYLVWPGRTGERNDQGEQDARRGSLLVRADDQLQPGLGDPRYLRPSELFDQLQAALQDPDNNAQQALHGTGQARGQRLEKQLKRIINLRQDVITGQRPR